MRRTLDRTGEIDARDHRPAPHDRCLTGEGETILVVDGRPFDADGDVALHQIGFIEVGERDRLTALRLLDHDCLQGRQDHSPTRGEWTRIWKTDEGLQPFRVLRLSSTSGRRNSRPGNWLLNDRQVDESGERAEQDSTPPDEVIGTGPLIQEAAEIDPQ